ncbi:SGNH hydrolase domain-containing protein [Brevundimonas sp.]|uniref:SGNH hydrolase domain-containing protein n=1 Tax=Brevundimonas sp. TaxID=1871086 RepID=UPI002ED78185
MNDAPDTASGAARQSWRAASCIFGLSVAAASAALIAPETAGWGLYGLDLALAAAGFVLTRQLLAGEGGVRGGLAVAAPAALWAVPALALVGVVVLLAGLFLLPPADLRNQAWTALWTAVGLSGGELLKQGWAQAVGGELLWHGFITGVAAQLAVGWALVLLALRALKRERWTGLVLILGMAAALAVRLWLEARGATLQVFYLAPPRAGVFFIGAFAAVVIREGSLRGGEGWIGAGARLSAFALPFWLWLWPLLLLPRMILARSLHPLESAAAVLVAAGLAVATELWVSRPLRRRLEGRPVRALIVCGVLLAGPATASAALFALDGLPGRASDAIRTEEAASQARAPLQALCHTEGVEVPAAAACTVPSGRTADGVLWGNSHASHLSPALLDWAAARGHAVRQATKSGCLPLIGRGSGLVDAGCARFNQLSIEEWGRSPPELILVGAGWTVVLEQVPGDDRTQLETLDRNLRATLALLRARVGAETRIVLLGTTPDYGFAPAACHARRGFLRLDTGRCDAAVPANAALMAAVDDRLARIAAETPGVILFRPSEALCEDGLCRTRGADGPWYSDRSHMTEAGGRAQTAALSAVLDRAETP